MRDQWLTALASRIRRFERSGDPALVMDPAAVELATNLAAAVDDPTLDLDVAYAVGMLYHHRVEAGGPDADAAAMRQAVRFLRPVYRRMPERVPAQMVVLIQVDDALAGWREDAAAGPEGSAEPAPEEADGMARFRRYEQTGEESDLRWSLAQMRTGFAELADDSTDRGPAANNIATALRELFDRTGEVAALEEAEQAARWAVDQVAAGGPERANVLATLAGILNRRYEQTGDPRFLADSLAATGEAMTCDTLKVPAVRAAVHGARAVTMTMRFEVTDDRTALAEAQANLRQAVAESPPDGSAHAAHTANLAQTLVTAYRASGDPGVLDEAVAIMRTLLAAVPADAAATTVLAANLGTALMSVYERTGSLETLAEVVTSFRHAAGRRAVAVPYADLWTGLLGAARFEWAQRTADLDALREAVDLCRLACETGDVRRPYRAVLVANLSTALVAWHRHGGDPAALDEALRLVEALLADPRPADRTMLLNNAAVVLLARFDATGDPGNLRRAVEVLRQAVDGPPAGPGRASHLGNLSLALAMLAASSGRTDLWREAAVHGRDGAGHEAAPAADRLFAARGWLSAALAGGDTAEAAAAADCAIALLPLLVTRRLARANRQHHLRRAGGLAADAIAATLATAGPDRAVETAEAVRGVLMAETVDARGDLARLRAEHLDLADVLDRLRTRLHGLDDWADAATALVTESTTGARSVAAARAAAEERARLSGEFEELVARIRQLPGFGRFMAPPAADELRAQAADGAIVMINASAYRSDAVVLRGDGVTVVRLPELTTAAVTGHAACLAGGPGDPVASLAWLWEAAVGPVLDALGHRGAPRDDWPRIWWCPVGTVSRLPLHAAGTATDNALDRVVSAYTPTVRALAHARRTPPAASAGLRALIVSVPDAEGLPHLDGVVEETARVARLLPQATVAAGPEATRARVVADLAGHTLVHFACHGVADEREPAAGGLALHDYDTGALTVGTLSHLRLDGASLAYLSACATAYTSNDLLDEPVHLAGACHLAGFRNVVGTLWPVHDAAAQRIAAGFYTALMSAGTVDPVWSLHQAVRAERARHPDAPRWWAGHVGYGP